MSGTSRFTPPSGRPLGRTLLTLVVACLLICAVLVGVGWLITHPLKSTMAHENSINRWFADQRTSGLTSIADTGTFIGQTLTGAWRQNTRTSTTVAPMTITFSGPETALMTLPNGRTTNLKRHRF